MAIAAAESITPFSSGQGQVASAGKKQMDMNSFLMMFTTQLKYQDPSNPLESYELAAQLAQFSSVEKLTEMNSHMVEQQSYLASINNAQMVDTLGKQVVGGSDALHMEKGQISNGYYDFDIPADVTVQILDEEGVLVRTMEMGVQDAGRHAVVWDGKNQDGESMPDGNYRFKVDAVSTQDGKPAAVATSVAGVACAFRVEDGVPYLVLGGSNGVKLPVSNILEVQNQSNFT